MGAVHKTPEEKQSKFVLVGLDLRDWKTIKAAAYLERRKMAEFYRYHSLMAARKILAKNGGKRARWA